MKDLRSSTVGLVTAALLLLVFCGWLFVWNDDGGGPLPVVMIIGAGQSLLLYGLVVVALTTVVMTGRRPRLAWVATSAASRLCATGTTSAHTEARRSTRGGAGPSLRRAGWRPPWGVAPPGSSRSHAPGPARRPSVDLGYIHLTIYR